MEVKYFDQVAKILGKETKEIRRDISDILGKIELGLTLGLPHVRPLTSIHSGLFEIRVKDKQGQFRVVYFIKKGDAVYLLHAFRKKTQKLPQKEIKVIMSRLKEIK
jgi:phage-related protein